MKINRLKFLLATGLTALGLSLTQQPACAITTSGVLTNNETWSGNIELTGDVTVPANVTLTILPGTRVACWDRTDDQVGGLNPSRIELTISGILNAVGTSSNPIVFTSSPLHPPALAGDWYGIVMNLSTNGNSTLTYCTIEYAVEGLRVAGAPVPSISNCLFQKSSSCGIDALASVNLQDCSVTANPIGIIVSRATVSLSGCSITNNQGDGIFITINSGNTTILATNTWVANNAGRGVDDGGNHNQYGSYCYASFNSCAISSNGGDGIYGVYDGDYRFCTIGSNGGNGLTVGGVLFSEGCDFSNNGIYGVNGGNGRGRFISCVATNNHSFGFGYVGYLSNCFAAYNGGVGMALDPYAVGSVEKCRVFSNQGDGLVLSGGYARNCVVRNNVGIGMKVTSPCDITGNDIAYNGTGIWVSISGANYTGISSNRIVGNTAYDLSNNGSAVVIATNNFWGEPTTTELANNVRNLTKIYDSQDNASVGQVILKPYLATDPSAVPPTLDTNTPVDMVAAQGGSATFNVTANSASTITYQWRKGTDALVNQTNAFLTLNPVRLSDAATNYNVIVANSDGSVTSRWATLTVLIAPSIISQPSGLLLPAGSTATFHVTATGSAPLAYQWQKGGVNLVNAGRVSGATSADLTITSILAADAGNYKVVVSNAVQAVTSQVARLDLPVPPTITTNPVSQVVGLGEVATFSVTATGSAPLNYQWYFNGSAIIGATSPSFTAPTTNAAWLGSYQAQVWNSAGTNWSSTAGLWLNDLKMYAGVNIYGPMGSNCVVQYATNLNNPIRWTWLQSATIVTNPTVIIDYTSPDQPKRFYRTLPQ